MKYRTLVSHGMNRFDREYWDGAREAALATWTFLKGRSDVPKEISAFVESLLRETGERKNRDFREAVGLAAPEPG